MDLYSHYSRQVQRIMDRAVARGHERRAAEEIAFVGLDEKSDLIGGRERAKARFTDRAPA